MNSIKVRQLFDYDTWTYTYLLWCEETKKCLLIDPVLEQVDRDLKLIEKLQLTLVRSQAGKHYVPPGGQSQSVRHHRTYGT